MSGSIACKWALAVSCILSKTNYPRVMEMCRNFIFRDDEATIRLIVDECLEPKETGKILNLVLNQTRYTYKSSWTLSQILHNEFFDYSHNGDNLEVSENDLIPHSQHHDRNFGNKNLKLWRQMFQAFADPATFSVLSAIKSD